MKKLELFESFDGKWRPLSLTSLARQDVSAAIWHSMEGKDIIGKLSGDDGEVLAYIAGTEELREKYRKTVQKRVLTWIEAAEMMEKLKSPLMDPELFEWIGASMQAFGTGTGAELREITYGDGSTV